VLDNEKVLFFWKIGDSITWLSSSRNPTNLLDQAYDEITTTTTNVACTWQKITEKSGYVCGN
jgi:hypothetical protein